jgi:hypothetical protein
MDSLCKLESDNVFDLMKLARQRLQKLCEARGIDALTEAVDKGFNNIRRLDGEILETMMVGNLKNHPTYPKLIEIMRVRRGKP